MSTLKQPSKGKIAVGFVLAVLGKLGLMVSSFYSLSTVVFFWPSDRLRLLRVVLILGVSILMMVGAARVFHDSHYWRVLFRSLPFIICSLGCLGVIRTIIGLYTKRQPHSVTEYEARWSIICFAALLLCILFLLRGKRHALHAWVSNI
jgi:hypothetical protein